MAFPQITRIQQSLDQPVIDDVGAEVRRVIVGSRLSREVPAGARIAVAVGSRGIANIFTIVSETLQQLLSMGYDPFVVAAMGSHGGATSQGQRELLGEYGVSAQRLGVPVLTDMDVVELGTNELGFPVFWDRNAFEADAVVTVSRIKPHTDFRSTIESGILKMLVIGLGKREGPSAVHTLGVRGLKEVMPSSAHVVLAKTKFVVGLGILENAAEQTAEIHAVHADELFDREPILLQRSRELMARLPFDQLDVLLVGEIGKNYSGAGIDPNVIGRLYIVGQPEFESPRISRIVVLETSPESHGNAVGVGLADFTTDRLIAGIDREPFLTNSIVSTFVERAKIPLSFPSDQQCLEAALQTCWQPDLARLRLAIIPNTLELSQLWVTEPLLDDLPEFGARTSGLREIPWDSSGNLLQEELFPDSLRARRAHANVWSA